MAMHSDMDILMDMMPEESIAYDTIESGKTNEYYQGYAEHILKSMDTNDTTEPYFHFVYTILKDYSKLTDQQKEIIQTTLGIQPKIVEKVVIKEKVVYKQAKKARLNTYDDY